MIKRPPQPCQKSVSSPLASIKLQEHQLKQAKTDLAQCLAAIRIFEASGDPKGLARYMAFTGSLPGARLVARGETWAIASASLRARGQLTTRELTQELMKAKGLEAGDRVFANTTVKCCPEDSP